MGVQVNSVLDFSGGSLKIGDLTQPFSAYENTYRSYDLRNYSWENCPLTWENFTKSWNMAGMTVFTVDATEAAALSEAATKTTKIKKKEPVAISEALVKASAKPIEEAAKVAEVYWDYIQFKLCFAENISVIETPKKTLSRSFADSFGIAERKVLRNSRKVLKEPVNFAELLKRAADYNLHFKEAAGLTDTSSTKLKKWLFEKVKATEIVPKKQTSALKKETAALSDNMTRKVYFDRDFAESVGISEAMAKTLALLKKDNAALYDAFIEATECVISNIAITEGDMSLDEFIEATETAPGYTPFMDFKVGEYEYQEALVRIVINAVAAQTQPSVTNVVMHVDIPDTQDRGTAEITDTSAPTRINFTKLFYIVPEVNVNLRGGNTGDGVVTPYITEMDKTGFEVQLLNDSGQLVTGLITWQATGY